MHRLMIVDDEENILRALCRVLRGQDSWEIETYANVTDALKRAKVANFDLFLSDFRMPEINGVQFLTEVKQLQPNAMRLIISGYTDLEALLGAINEAQIFRFVTKPWVDYDIITTLKQALSYRDMLVENRYLADQVREQQQELDKRRDALEKLKISHPDLFEVNWSADGSIIIND